VYVDAYNLLGDRSYLTTSQKYYEVRLLSTIESIKDKMIQRTFSRKLKNDCMAKQTLATLSLQFSEFAKRT